MELASSHHIENDAKIIPDQSVTLRAHASDFLLFYVYTQPIGYLQYILL